MEKQQPTLESTLKSADTEEFIDIHFYRPIGYRWALLFQKLNITPNAVTIASIFLGIGAGVCFYFDNIWINLLGIFLLVWANSYDSADGQLARMTKQYSALGRVLDGFAGNLWFASIYVAICLRLFPEWGGWIWVLACVTGYFHSKQAEMADYYRNVHLLFLKGKAGSELDNSKDLTEKFKQLSWGKNFWAKLVLFFYRNYTTDQENWSPRLQKLFKILKEKFGEVAPQPFRDDFRQASLPLMKYTNILSFNTRSIALFTSILIGWPWLYFVFELTVLNILLVYMISRHEKICKGFTGDIKNGKYN
ncbi:MAG: CDP-alcohol phosphatidyltransferase family protein [Prevotella sp.]|jgi:hypothetical protein|nr:CDP-alcohol phosphatidyltransferase family protein [Prevotella sp.]